MITEYKNDKVALLSALEQADSNLSAHVSTYALCETEDPLHPFEICLVHDEGVSADAIKRLNERLFDHAFLDFGYKEVFGEDNLEGVIYAPIEELFTTDNCIGVAPRSLFDVDEASVRMAREADDEEDESSPSMRFMHFLHAVDGHVISGKPARKLMSEDILNVCGLLFKYATGNEASSQCIVAFQRTQRMWIQERSSFLLFDGVQSEPDVFSSRSIRIGTTFDFVLFGSNVFFRNLRALEILFKFNKLVSARAKDYADTLDPIVADFEKLDERIEASRGVANKLLKMQKDGCLVAELDPEELEQRAHRIAYYSNKLKFNEDGKIMLTTNREVNDFIRMLNDDYVVSPLTQEGYEARSKKSLKAREEAASQPYDSPF